MRNYAIINSSTRLVENTILWDGLCDWSAPDGFEAVQSDAALIGWSYSDGQFLEPPKTSAETPTAEQITAALTAAVQAHMDAQSRALNYDDIKTAVTYADEPAVPKFQAEGLAFREWRSLCWAHCYAAMAAAHLGERAIPTAEELIAELPTLVLPE